MVGLDDKLKKLRLEHNMTQLQVAQRIGVSKAVISSYETTSRMPSYDVIIKLATLYGVSVDYLLGLDTRTLLDVSDLSPIQLNAIKAVIESYRK